jgi:hypothetical protein
VRLGVTGTRHGLSQEQKQVLTNEFFDKLEPIDEFHSGLCLGVDHEVFWILWERDHVWFVGHPPLDRGEWFDEYTEKFCGELWPAKSHFARNRDIVDNIYLLLACPPFPHTTDITTVKSGGTAYTVNYAIKKKVEAVVIYSDGFLEEFNVVD